jgi:hypothetical protein
LVGALDVLGARLRVLHCGVGQIGIPCDRVRVVRVGLVKPVKLRCLRVFVDQSAEDRASLDSGIVKVDDLRRRIWWSLFE